MITALAVMIAVAGYLNFAGDTIGGEEITVVDNQSINGVDDLAQVAADISDEPSIDYDIVSLDEDISLDTEVVSGEVVAVEDQGVEVVAVEGEGVEVAGIEEDILSGEIPGEAVFASTNTSMNTLSGARLIKEQARAKNKEVLLEIINNEAIESIQKQEAIDSMIIMTDITEKESSAEILLEAKGFEDAIVSINGESVDIVVKTVELTDAKRAQIEDIIKRKTGMSGETIVITSVATE